MIQDPSSKIKIRDKRNKGWFYLDNEYLNGYAKVFGAIGTAIYVSLCRHVGADQKCFPSQELIAKELHIGVRTVRRYLKMFQEYNLIYIERNKRADGKWLHNEYYLLDKSVWKPVHRPQRPMVSHGSITTNPEANSDSNQRPPWPSKNTHSEEHSLGRKPIRRTQSVRSSSISYLSNIPEKDVMELTKRYGTTEEIIKSKAEDVMLLCESKGIPIKNYKAFLFSILNREFKKRSANTKNIYEKN